MNPWEDPDVQAYRKALQHDPCAYCGGPGGTIDHIVPRAKGGGRWDTDNWTGACVSCNRRKDKHGDAHRSILEFLGSRRHWKRAIMIEVLMHSLRSGAVVYTPWGDYGIVKEIERGRGVRDVNVWLPSQQRVWRCANPYALRTATGHRMADAKAMRLRV